MPKLNNARFTIFEVGPLDISKDVETEPAKHLLALHDTHPVCKHAPFAINIDRVCTRALITGPCIYIARPRAPGTCTTIIFSPL